MNANVKTSSLKREDIPVAVIVKNTHNPNKMNNREFDLLVDNINRTGLTDPILVRPLEDGTYRIVGGHHRFDAALYLGFDEVPCTVITDPAFDQEEEDMQLVRMNMIHGKLDPQAFFDLYSKYASKYGDAVLQDSFGFADEAEWKRMVTQLAKQLPDKAMKDKFLEAAKDVKTIDGLAQLLNSMFTKYGNTLPHGYMMIDYGGQRSLWLRATNQTIKNCDSLGMLCIEKNVTLDDVMAGVLKFMLSEAGQGVIAPIMEKAPKVHIPENLVGVPTYDKLEKAAEASNG